MYYSWLQRHASLVLVGTLLAAVVALFGATKLTVTPDNRVFYGPENTQFNNLLDFEANYTPNNNILFVISGVDRFTHPRAAQAVRWLDEEAWGITNVLRVDSVASYPIALGTEDSISIEPLLDLLCPLNLGCTGDQNELLQKPQLVNRLVSHDQQATTIFATFSIEVGVIDEIEAITQETEDLARQFREEFPEFELVVTGGIPMMAAFSATSQEDLSQLLPIAFIVILGLLIVFFGDFKPAALLIVIAIITITSTMGLAGWANHRISATSSIVPLVVFTLVIASSMHIVVHYLRLVWERPDDPQFAAKAALESNMTPMLVSSATTMAGLLSLSFLDSPPLQQLGYLSAVGVFIGTLLTLIVFPIFLGRIRTKRTSYTLRRLQQLLNDYARRYESGRSFVVAGLAFVLISIVGVTQIEIDDDFVRYFSEDTEFRKNTDRVTELIAGPNHIEVLLASPFEAGVFDPAYVKHLQDLTAYLRNHEAVSSASSFSDILMDLAGAFDKPIETVTTSEELAQWYLVYELSLQRGQSNTDFVRADHNESRISVLLNDTTSKEIQQLESSIYEWHRSQDSQFELLVTGENIPVAHISWLNIQSMVAGIVISILITALLVGLLVRHVRLGIVTLIAIIAPILCGFGIWGFAVGTMGLATTAIIALTIGIAVDDSVHMVYRYLDGRRRLDLDPTQASAYSLHRVGTALSTTSIVMLGGLSALLFSDFEINSSVGAGTCLIIASALIFDLLVLPSLLAWADQN